MLKNAGNEVISFAMQDKKNIHSEQMNYFVSNIDFNDDTNILNKVRAAFRMVYSFEAKKKISKLIEKEHPDIVHINLFHRVLTGSIIDAIKKYNIPIVLTIHDSNCFCPNHMMLDHNNVCEDCLHGNYFNCVKRKCFKESRAKCIMAAFESEFNKLTDLYNKIDLFISPSEFFKRKMEQSTLTKSPIIHMKNFLPENTEYGVKGKRGDYILYYGRVSEEKGILTLVRSMQHLPNASLIIVGTGPEEKKIHEEVSKLKLNDRVTLAGFKKGEELWRYVREAACVVVPSEWYEASGYTACEAQAMGKVVVATDAGGLPENIIDKETGFICEMKNEVALAKAIQSVFDLDDDQYNRMSAKAVENAYHLFNSQQYVKRLVEIYEKLIAQKKKG